MNLVTGATGLVGAHVAFRLADSGQAVRLLHRKTADRNQLRKIFSLYTNDPTPLLERIEWVEGDVTNSYSIEDALDGVQHVYHCAAMVSFVPAERKAMLAVNIEGTANMVNASIECGVKKFCMVSSVAALGMTTTRGVISETNEWKNDPSNSWYAISKYGAEREAWRGTEEGLDVVIVNPSLILGPGDYNRSSLEMIRMVAKGLRWHPGGSGGFVDVRDVARAMVELVNSDIINERFILSGYNFSYKDFLAKLNAAFGNTKPTRLATPFLTGLAWRSEKILAALAGRKPRITKETARSSQEQHQFTGEKITQRLLGFSYTPMDQTIADVAAFYRKLNSVS